MRSIIKDENQTIESFLHFNKLYSLIDETIYNDKDEIIDKNKALKDYGFHNGDRYKFDGLYRGYGPFTDNKFFDNIVLSDLIKKNNQNVLEIYSPSGKDHCPLNEIKEEMSFDVIGSNTGPVFGGKHGRYSLDSNICKAAVFEGKVSIGQKALVFLKIIKNNNCFEGDTRNGITTSDSRNISDLCFVFTGQVYPESYYYPKMRKINC